MTPEQIAAAARLAIAEQGTARIALEGTSMWPLYRPGQAILVEALRSPARPGEVVVFLALGRLHAHRVRRVGDGGWLTTRGDATANEDPPVEPSCVVGRVVAVEAEGRRGRLTRRGAAMLLPAFDRVAPRLTHRARRLAAQLARLASRRSW